MSAARIDTSVYFHQFICVNEGFTFISFLSSTQKHKKKDLLVLMTTSFVRFFRTLSPTKIVSRSLVIPETMSPATEEVCGMRKNGWEG